jgi:hypothetical protein
MASNGVFVEWRLDELKKGVVGFDLRRRHLDGERWTDWVTVGPNLIQPDLTEAHLEKLDLKAVLGRMDEWDRLGNPRTPGAILKKMHSSAKEFQQAAAMSQTNREWAVAFGMAWSDAEAPKGAICEYRLSPVLEDAARGRIVGEPIDVIRLRASAGAIMCPELEDLKAVRTSEKTVKVSFRVRKAVIDSYRGAAYLGLLKAAPSEPMRNVIDKQGIRFGSVSKDGAFYEFAMSDKQAGNVAIKYAIAPITLSGTRGQLSERVVVSRVKEPVVAPEIQCRTTPEGVVVTWKHEGQEDGIEGFRIVRRVIGKRLAETMKEAASQPSSQVSDQMASAELSPPGARSWTDGTALTECQGMRVRYAVIAVSGDYRENQTGMSEAVQIPLPTPPTPGGLKAKVAVKKDAVVVKCEWDAVDAKGVAGYRVQEYLEQEGIWYDCGSLATNSYKKEVGKNGGSIKLRVMSVTMDGQRSVPSEPLLIEYPSTKKIPVDQTGFWMKKKPDGGLVLLWNAPAWDHIKGFRIERDGKLIAGEKELGRYVREYTIWSPPEKTGKYRLYIVDTWGQVSDPVLNKDTPTTSPRKTMIGSGGRDVNKAKEVSEDKPYFKEKDKIYSRCEYLQWEDGHKILHGTSTYYRRDGQVHRTQEWRLGQIHGVSRKYSETGELNAVLFYLGGKLTSMEEFVKAEGDKALTEADRKWLKERTK